ncbi:MAG: hypothetical protein HYT12_00945 [Candidatus Liptonbacteria bacterium]|nr:hypothetical protein [Candidatus Liptonbacteria bacterium]
MTRYAFIYIANSFFYSIFEFFFHWYVNGFWLGSGWLIDLLERLDRFFAFRVTLRHFGEPLFQDRTIVGYILGFIFRSGRLLIGAIAYFFIFILAIMLYLGWAAILPYVIYRIII